MKKQTQNLYEGMYIISATLSEEARQRALDKITQGIESLGGNIEKLHEMGKRRLAYEIEDKREGFYYVIYFTAPTEAIAELWKEYHLHEDLIRFTTLRAEKVLETLTFPPLPEVN